MLKLLKNKNFVSILAGAAALGYLAFFVWWQMHKPVGNIEMAVPGLDQPDTLLNSDLSQEKIQIGEMFESFATDNSDLTGKWSAFRGTNRDNQVVDPNLKLPPKITKSQLVWSIETGEGHAAPAIFNGKVFFLDYNETQRMDILKCLSLTNGRELWHRGYKVHLKRNHGMSRTIPAVTEKYVLSIGPKGHVMCTETGTGNLKWGIDIEQEYHSEIPFWYTGQCPMVDNQNAILATGGDALLIGVDCETGKTVWKTPNPLQWKMSHSSIVKITIENVDMYIYAAIGGVAGISAMPRECGKILWQTSEWNPSVVAPSPLYLGNGKILVTAGYGAGSAVIQITKSSQGFQARILQKIKPSEGIASEQQTPVLHNNLVYCILPKDAGTYKNQLACYQPEMLTKPLWSSGKARRFGLGPYMVLNHTLVILNDEGSISLVETGTNFYSEIYNGKLFEGQDAWGPFAYTDGFLLARDSKHLYCYDLNKK